MIFPFANLIPLDCLMVVKSYYNSCLELEPTYYLSISIKVSLLWTTSDAAGLAIILSFVVNVFTLEFFGVIVVAVDGVKGATGANILFYCFKVFIFLNRGLGFMKFYGLLSYLSLSCLLKMKFFYPADIVRLRSGIFFGGNLIMVRAWPEFYLSFVPILLFSILFLSTSSIFIEGFTNLRYIAYSSELRESQDDDDWPSLVLLFWSSTSFDASSLLSFAT